MIEQTVREYLADKVSVPVVLERPDDGSTSFVVIERTSGNLVNGIHGATIAVQSYGDSLLHAARLNEQVVNALLVMAETKNVYSCKLNADYNYTDTNTKHYRYQAVFEIYY